MFEMKLLERGRSIESVSVPLGLKSIRVSRETPLSLGPLAPGDLRGGDHTSLERRPDSKTGRYKSGTDAHEDAAKNGKHA